MGNISQEGEGIEKGARDVMKKIPIDFTGDHQGHSMIKLTFCQKCGKVIGIDFGGIIRKDLGI